MIDYSDLLSVVLVSVVDTDFTVYENEGALLLCLQVNHTVRTRALVTISTYSGTAIGWYNVAMQALRNKDKLIHQSSLCAPIIMFNFVLPADEDFVPVEKMLVFDEGLDTTQCLYVPILNDECLEYEEEYFTINLSSDQDCVYFVNDSYEATIIDDDCEYYMMLIHEQQLAKYMYEYSYKYSLLVVDVVIGFVEAGYTVLESVGVTEVCVELCSGNPKRNFEFYVDIANGSASSMFTLSVLEIHISLKTGKEFYAFLSLFLSQHFRSI